MKYQVRPLEADVDRKDFECGVQELDRYFREFAAQDIRRKVGRTYVTVLVEEPTKAIGYYTLAAASVVPKSFPIAFSKILPRYPIPAVILGRLAVSTSRQGTGVGEFLLMDALRRSLDLSKIAGACAVIVDTKDDKAKSFYQRYGFIPFVDSERSLFLSMLKIEKIFPGE